MISESQLNTYQIRLKPIDGDASCLVREALEQVPHNGRARLVFEKGDYDFYEDSATEMFCYVSNNSDGLKRVMCLLDGYANLEIEGNGAQFHFHGRVCPFLIKNCRNISIKNLTINYPRPFVSQGLIQAVGPDFIDIKVDASFPYMFDGQRIWFSGERYAQKGFDNGKIFKRDSFLHCLEFDSKRRETAFQVRDNFKVACHEVIEIKPGFLRLRTQYPLPQPKVGNYLAVSHDHRDCFGILMDGSKNVHLELITMHDTGAMGFIAQLSENITLKSCTVAPKPETNRIVSSFADASHFVNCRGLIKLLNCRFENMLDDPINVHGIYSPIRRIINSRTLEIGNGHYEQAGIAIAEAGTKIQFVGKNSLLPKGSCVVTAVKQINSFLWRLNLDSDCPVSAIEGDCVESLHWIPDVEIRGCAFGKNRARGPLISTAGKVVIDGNHFHHAGSAIKISGDTNNWFESGAVKDVIISNNTFDNCGYGTWGRGIIAIDPEIKPESFKAERYHKNIRIIDNVFNTFHNELIFARCIDGLIIKGNLVKQTKDYPCKNIAFDGVMLEHCKNVDSQFSEEYDC